jgi:glycosyltransferase involved in cell wall biosynthesis
MNRLGVLGQALSGDRPTGLGVYTREVLRHTPWPAGTTLFADRTSAKRSWTGPVVEIPAGTGLSMKLGWQLARLDPVLRGAGCSVLYAPTHELAPVTRLPVVMMVPDLIPLLFPHLSSRKLTAFFRHLLPRTCERAARLVALSEQTKRDLVSHYGLPPEKIVVIPCGYDRQRFRPASPEQRAAFKAKHGLGDFLLYVGRFSEPKNVGVILEAFAQVRRNVSQDLVLVGPDEKKETGRLRELAATLGITDRVKWLPYVPIEELPVAYSSADAFVTASLYEGFGLPPLEAMACGTPVVVSDVSSLPEVVGDAGWLFDPRDPAALAAVLGPLLSSETARADGRRRGLARAVPFSWERTGLMTRAAIDEVWREN